MVTRTLSLSYGGVSLDLDDAESLAGAGFSGTGLAPVEAQWLAGAGSGSTWRGSRILPRELKLPIHFAGDDAEAVAALADDLDFILDPSHAAATLTVTFTTPPVPPAETPTVVAWAVDVIRTDGGDWTWGEDTTGSTWLSTEVTLTAGDPYWTRTTAETVASVTPGTVSLVNAGTAAAWPVWTFTGPLTGFTLTGPGGAEVAWAGVLAAAETVVVNAEAATVYKGATNVYSGLGAVPRFWAIPAGTTSVSVTVDGAGAGTNVALSYYPRRGLVF